MVGIEPPEEMRARMHLQPHEACELLKSAYGLVNAPLLWYTELKTALLSLGFLMSPLDPCVFVLPKKEYQSGKCGSLAIHGLLGIHADDGLGGGDQVFEDKIRQLESRYPFGSKRKQRHGVRRIAGLHIHQDLSGSIQVDQKDYAHDIPSIHVSRERRQEPKSPVTPKELQLFRGLIGSLQYAATNTRPDISCRLSLLQAKIPSATVQDLLQGNRLLTEIKNFAEVHVKYQPIPIEQIRFIFFRCSLCIS